jgi:hypothetical protein
MDFHLKTLYRSTALPNTTACLAINGTGEIRKQCIPIPCNPVLAIGPYRIGHVATLAHGLPH